jgi:hypothetical protein
MTLLTPTVVRRYGRLIGQQYGALILVDLLTVERIEGKRLCARFRCVCGNLVARPVGRVRSGRYSSCGCQTDHRTNLQHGMRNSREYAAWMGMKGRCMDPGNRDYAWWGGRGVGVCAEWANSFEMFFAHVGPRPAGTSLDRIDTLRGYEPGNVRWATPRQQAENRRNAWTVEVCGTTYPSFESAAIAHNVSATTVTRWCRGYTDPRRERGFVPPRPECHQRRTYL